MMNNALQPISEGSWYLFLFALLTKIRKSYDKYYLYLKIELGQYCLYNWNILTPI